MGRDSAGDTTDSLVKLTPLSGGYQLMRGVLTGYKIVDSEGQPVTNSWSTHAGVAQMLLDRILINERLRKPPEQ